MLAIIIDTAAAENLIDKMIERIVDFNKPMNDEFLAWQADDMNRQRPEARASEDAVETTILPRGKKSIGRRYRPRHYGDRLRKPLIKRPPRPILRPVLYDMLCERMGKLMQEELQWR